MVWTYLLSFYQTYTLAKKKKKKKFGVTEHLQGSLLSSIELKWRFYFTLVESPAYQNEAHKNRLWYAIKSQFSVSLRAYDSNVQITNFLQLQYE